METERMQTQYQIGGVRTFKSECRQVTRGQQQKKSATTLQ